MATAVKATVLVVEDDAQLRGLYRSALRSAGYVVIAVEDGADALRQIEQVTPAAIVLDLALPRVGGRDVYHELKSHSETQQIPIIVVTGTDTSDLDAKAFACVLRKPIGVEALVSAVEKCLRRSAAARSSFRSNPASAQASARQAVSVPPPAAARVPPATRLRESLPAPRRRRTPSA